MKQTKFNKAQTLLYRIGLAIVLAWIAFSVIQLQFEIDAKRSVLNDLNTQIAAQQRICEELADENANDDIYLEQQARNKGLAKPGEIIYKEVPGN